MEEKESTHILEDGTTVMVSEKYVPFSDFFESLDNDDPTAEEKIAKRYPAYTNEPKEADWREELIYSNGNITQIPYCPNCKEMVVEEEGHCWYCGQPITFELHKNKKGFSTVAEVDGETYFFSFVPNYNTVWANNQSHTFSIHTAPRKDEFIHSEEELKEYGIRLVKTLKSISKEEKQ